MHIHSRKSDSNTHDKSQKTVTSTLPADGATCSKVTHVCLNKFFDMCNINFYHHPLWLLSIALSLPMANVRHHLATCCLDITSFTYTSTSCQWISAADTFCAHQTRVTPQTTNKTNGGSLHWTAKAVLLCICLESWLQMLQPSDICINSTWNFKETGISNNGTFYNPTLCIQTQYIYTNKKLP